ncbi:ureidoglycolate lyase [Microcystis aeruginosa]|uniref:ureidoglycolate lyase n=1 Tax=Microcystis aeruginosa TaxID=1126 RepID=UPI00232F11C0|nr:ureidoglycolate lyase [Microcystis aeruginosa]MDB9414140.1 ureidoglycolate lyase [Microcystis aeruginosa CS-567/02]
MSNSITVRPLSAQLITAESFRPYGQLITPSHDGKPFDESDAQLHLKNGVPRFYIMRLQTRGRKFKRITRHSQCTQCLGSLGGQEWFLGVAPPSPYPQPDLEKLKVFRIPGDCFIKLEVGTWHAGPLFDQPTIDFYNLELSDTNIIDHFTYNFAQEQSIEFEIVD